MDDSTASATGDALVGLKLLVASTVAFEDRVATDEAKVNVAKSGYLASHAKAAESVERVLDARMLWPHGGGPNHRRSRSRGARVGGHGPHGRQGRRLEQGCSR